MQSNVSKSMRLRFNVNTKTATAGGLYTEFEGIFPLKIFVQIAY